jgi:hypothetical protein
VTPEQANSPKRQSAALRLVASLWHLRTFVPIALALCVLWNAYSAGFVSGVAGATSHLYVNLNALTAALSSKVYGLKGHPYQGYRIVRDTLERSGLKVTPQNWPKNFQDHALLTSALAAASSVDTCGSPLVSEPYNDQGLSEFVQAAFWIFGVDVTSMYRLYFVLILVSVLAYVVTFWRNYVACTLLFACAVAVYSFIPGFIYNNDQLIGVSNPRFLSSLGIIPLLHILMMIAGADGRRTGWPSLLALLVQAALVSLAIEIRSTAQWMEIALVAVLFGLGAWAAFGGWRNGQGAVALRSFALGPGAVALYVAATLFMMGSARALYLPPTCGTGLNVHTFWHNLLQGFTEHPEWREHIAAEQGLADLKGDNIAWTAAKRYVEKHHLSYQTQPSIWTEPSGPHPAGADPIPFGSWQTYEHIMRNVVFDFVRSHPKFVIETFLFYKPRMVMANLTEFVRTVIAYAGTLALVVLGVMLVILGALSPDPRLVPDANSRQFLRSAALVALSFVISLVPLWLVQTDVHLITDPGYLAIAGAVFPVAWLIGLLLRRLMSLARYRHALRGSSTA